jgi:hypothetical protein
LSILATGAVSYQWKWLNGSLWQDVNDLVGAYSGATSPSLTIIGSMDLNGTQYYCEVHSTDQCFASSNAVNLTINPIPPLKIIYHN